jgi:hypothetical protein
MLADAREVEGTGLPFETFMALSMLAADAARDALRAVHKQEFKHATAAYLRAAEAVDAAAAIPVDPKQWPQELQTPAFSPAAQRTRAIILRCQTQEAALADLLVAEEKPLADLVPVMFALSKAYGQVDDTDAKDALAYAQAQALYWCARAHTSLAQPQKRDMDVALAAHRELLGMPPKYAPLAAHVKAGRDAAANVLMRGGGLLSTAAGVARTPLVGKSLPIKSVDLVSTLLAAGDLWHAQHGTQGPVDDASGVLQAEGDAFVALLGNKKYKALAQRADKALLLAVALRSAACERARLARGDRRLEQTLIRTDEAIAREYKL